MERETDTKPPYRDGATYIAANAFLRMGADPEYREVAEAVFGHVPTGFEMKEAIVRVRRDGVRLEERSRWGFDED